jgi:nucleoid DNA-binding protein
MIIRAKAAPTTSKRKRDWAGKREGFRHQLVLALVAEGLSFRDAEKVITALFESMKEALLRQESVELPFGTLLVVRNEQRRLWRFGKVIRLRQYKIILDNRAPE